ncbi:MAG: cytochrome d ubiquinol oxidase subunit II [Deltaproteobacteria bacterium]|nr:cytochrome d ubiquinol oxidase subunit II [Deltaproteobacteria bacterium]
MSFDLNTLWFVLVGVLLTGYAILDGFDLGVGALHLFVKEDRDRRILLNSIGPVWDGNEVWLVTGGGALFAAFPEVYASVFSGFYLAFMLLLFMLIFRAVSIEFRSKHPSPRWRRSWDVAFSVGSIGAALLTGVALGNIAYGVPLAADFTYGGTFFALLKPYPLVVGLTTVALFTMHANIYLLLKTEGELYERVRSWVKTTVAAFVIMYVATTLFTLLTLPHMMVNLKAYPGLFIVPVLNLLMVLNIPRELSKGHDGLAFLSSCASIVLLMMLFGIGIFPNIVYSIPNPHFSLNIYNAASSALTLKVMTIMAALGMPMVLAYTMGIYWVFRGKVKLDTDSY